MYVYREALRSQRMRPPLRRRRACRERQCCDSIQSPDPARARGVPPHCAQCSVQTLHVSIPERARCAWQQGRLAHGKCSSALSPVRAPSMQYGCEVARTGRACRVYIALHWRAQVNWSGPASLNSNCKGSALGTASLPLPHPKGSQSAAPQSVAGLDNCLLRMSLLKRVADRALRCHQAHLAMCHISGHCSARHYVLLRATPLSASFAPGGVGKRSAVTVRFMLQAELSVK
jgi:hypothetical protein